ncbi:MAG: 3',5'-cyclic-nucleotide phosphodiesterase [Deltaproteobacteria bacterium]|nr:3',5'-cyclic-nucleotide phosphodiesterase [Deltaproteobacteria bacterium]
MNIEILGSSGGDYNRFRSTSVLLNKNILIDAGAVVSILKIDEILEIDNIILTHPHMDHVKDLAMISDLIVKRRKRPLNIWGTRHTISVLKNHLFNDLLWPDFTKIPSRNNPTIKYRIFEGEKKVNIDHLTILPVPVNHTVETMGFIISQNNSSFAISGDTGPTDRLWEYINNQKNIKCIFVELSFPESKKDIAKDSKHLTPHMLKKELSKLTNHKNIPVFLYHMKPLFYETLLKEVKENFNSNIIPLNSYDRFRL